MFPVVSPPIFQIIIRKYLKNGAASGTEWSEPPRKKFGKWLCLSGIFRVPLIKATPCLEKDRAFYCIAVGAGIVRLPELRGGRRLPRVVGDADLYRLYGNTA